VYETPSKNIFYSDFTLACVMHISYSFSYRQLQIISQCVRYITP